MLHKLFQRLWTQPGASRRQEELIAGAAVPIDLVRQRALQQPQVESLLESLRAGLSMILTTDVLVEELLERLVVRFAAYVMDLPASARDHHAQRWGLLVHSLDAGRIALRKALQRRMEFSSDPVASYKLLPAWQYTAFLLALMHDVGKVTDVEVLAPGPGPEPDRWDPYEEPLASFYASHPQAASILHRAGRRPEEHKSVSLFFVSRIVTPAVMRFIRPVFAEALAGQTPTARMLWEDLVLAADTQSSQQDNVAGGAEDQFLSDFVAAVLRLAEQKQIIANDPFRPGLLVGERYAAIVYPQACESVARALGTYHVQLLHDDRPAVALARRLHSAGVLWVDAATESWRVRFLVQAPGAPAQTAILLRLGPEPLARLKALGAFRHPVRFVLSDGRTLDLGDFAAPVQAPKSEACTPPPQPIAIDDPRRLLTDFKSEIVSGRIPRNLPRAGLVYITPAWTFAVVPAVFEPLQQRGYPNPRVQGALYPYLSALGRLRVIWADEATRRSVFRVRTPPGASGKPLNVVAFPTDLLFTQQELATLGYWTFDVEPVHDGAPLPPGLGRPLQEAIDDPKS